MPELNHNRETIVYFLKLYFSEKEITSENILTNFMPYYLSLTKDERIDEYELGLVLSLFNKGKQIAILEEARNGLIHYFYFDNNEENTGIEVKTFKYNSWWETSWFNVSEFFDF